MDTKSSVSELSFSREVKTCSESDVLGNVIKELKQGRYGSIIIEENKKVKGIFTERDFLTKIGDSFEKYKDQPISNFMTPDPVSVTLDSPVIQVLEYMHKGRFRHIVVVDNSNELVGIISIKDLMNFLIDSIKILEEEMADLVAAII